MIDLENKILTITEPSIELDELNIIDAESGTQNSNYVESELKLSKFYSAIALVNINGYEVTQDRIDLIKLKNTNFYPIIKIIFDDRDTLFQSRHFPKDGDIIKVYIRSKGNEETFKPIRIDFSLIEINPVSGGGDTSNKFRVEGRMFIPDLFTENTYFFNGTSFDTLLNISEDLQLGFASNVDHTNDSMIWINPNDTAEKYIKDITAASYLDDGHFFISYIDPYYYLNFVNINSLFSQEGDIEMSKSFKQNSTQYSGKNNNEGDTDMPNMLTNLMQFQGDSRYISKHQMINEAGLITKNNGYKRYSQLWDYENNEFINEFIDPITTNTPGFIPATKGRIIDGEPEGPRNNQVKFKYLGIQNENVHSEYSYSLILNHQNLLESSKIGMTVELDTMNPALTRYSRIYCQIYEYANPVKGALTQFENNEKTPPENAAERETKNEGNKTNEGILNEFLSGFYIITGIEYIQTRPGLLRTKLYLNRREFKPTT